ncbi:MAG TPA: MBL fold metallo-hydrolase [Chthoniobacterales bacterium]|jgi:glyoxylase-like metal-dependent hydrolase (beta-lactamase superfamily II)
MNNRPNFSRRDALSLLGLTAAALAARPASAASTKAQEDTPLLYRFRIGDFSALAVSDGFLRVPEPHSFYAPQESTAEFQALLKDWYISPDRVFLPFNVLLIDTGKERVLIDAGNGDVPDRVDPALGRAQLAFQSAGYGAEDISVVFLSHGHPDHLGGLVTTDNQPTYPHAQHFVLKTEFDFWTSPNPDLSAGLASAELKKYVLQFAQKRFPVLKDRFVRIDDGAEFTPGFRAMLAPGHTPGHSIVDIQSGSERLLHIVDLAHHQVVPLQKPAWKPIPDGDPEPAAQTRQRVFAQIAQDRTRVFGYHLPFPGVGHIRVSGSGYEWVPEPWTPA